MTREQWLTHQLEALQHELRLADNYRKGGSDVNCAPRFTSCPPGTRAWLKRLCRDALETPESYYKDL